MLVLLAAKPDFVEMLRRDKGNQKQACKCDPANRRHFFGEKIQQRGRKQDKENGAQENRKLDGANADVQRNLELARASVLEPEHNHSQGNKDEAPDHSEGIRLSQDNHVPAADQDSE